MNAVSLFAGVGGFDLAFERNGVDVIAAVEIDANARGVLKRNFPQTKLFDDVCTVTGKDLINAGFNPREGIIAGGFPCQDLSVAGKRAGLDGSRSGLFFEIVRLLDETKAKFFILENVPGLLSSQSGADMATVISALDDLGYSVAWRVFDAQHFGVPQRRRRIFIVGCLGDDWSTPAQILALSEGRAGHLAKSNAKRKDTPAKTSDSLARMRGFGDYELDETSSALKARDYKDATDLVVRNEITGPLQARDFKGVGNQYVAENKLVVHKE
jgi:DNA (cytosine-5)-methyltransferase 1